MLVMPAVFWCFDRTVGLRLGLILLTSSFSNAVLKLHFGLPRPYWISTQVSAYAFEPSFGLPSGHAQNALAVLGRLAKAVRRGWAMAAAAVLILLISLSRIYLGVHFPLDLVAGWLMGGLLLALFLVVENPAARALAHLTLVGQLLLVLVLSLGALWLGLAAWAMAAARSIPVGWLISAASAHASGELVDPRQLEPLFALTGILLGFSAGAVLLRRWGRFSVEGSRLLRAGRYAIGSAGVAALYLGLGSVSLSEGTILALAWEYLRYASVGFWISYLAPRSFDRLGLLQPVDGDGAPRETAANS